MTDPITEDFDGARDTLAVALGRATIAWGRFHEELAHLFSAALTGGIERVALAAWHCHRSDRAQRDMLQAVAKAGLQTRPKLSDLIANLASTANNISDFRNDVIHASYAYYVSENKFTMVLYDYYENTRSIKLANKYKDGILSTVLLAFEKSGRRRYRYRRRIVSMLSGRRASSMAS